MSLKPVFSVSEFSRRNTLKVFDMKDYFALELAVEFDGYHIMWGYCYWHRDKEKWKKFHKAML